MPPSTDPRRDDPKTQRIVDRYFERYASIEADTAARIEGTFEHVLAVPVRDESVAFVDRLGVESSTETTLVIVVLNGTGALTPHDQDVLAHLTDAASVRLAPDLWRRDRGSSTWLLVDRCRGEGTFAPQQGVGLARKIGLDLGLALWRRGQLVSPWLHTTDADATLPREHFTIDDPDAIARTARYWHDTWAGDALAVATAHYELWMRQYVAGLAGAGSPYAFEALGSCISVRADAYAHVRGVPDRRAGEDFYLLAKLAKLGPIARSSPAVGPVLLRPRVSGRVPFGTGPAVARLLQQLESGTAPRLYDPQVFEVLARFQSAIATGRNVDGATIAPEFRAGLERASKSATNEAQRRRSALEWFDALRTLQFVHAAQKAHPDVAWTDALARSPVDAAPVDDRPGPLDIDAWRRHLERSAPARSGLGAHLADDALSRATK